MQNFAVWLTAHPPSSVHIHLQGADQFISRHHSSKTNIVGLINNIPMVAWRWYDSYTQMRKVIYIYISEETDPPTAQFACVHRCGRKKHRVQMQAHVFLNPRPCANRGIRLCLRGKGWVESLDFCPVQWPLGLKALVWMRDSSVVFKALHQDALRMETRM